MIPVEHISLFLDDQKTGDKNFPYRHNLVAEKLGYGKTENYRQFRKFLINSYVENIDYKKVKLSVLDGFVGPPTNPSPIKRDILGRINKAGTKEQTDIYILSRITLNRICIDSIKPIAKLVAHSFAKI